MKKKDELPFIQNEKNGIKVRLFKENVNNQELKWHFDEKDRNVTIIKSNGWYVQMDNTLPKKLVEGETIFIPKGVYHRVIKGNGDLVIEIKEFDNVITESKHKLQNEIRTIVKDIITIFKSNDDGEFYLPEDINDELTYNFQRLGVELTIELDIEISDDLDTYKVNAAYWSDDDTISVKIIYNQTNKTKIIYDLVGELNEILAHEMRHIVQRQNNTYDLDIVEPEDSFEYYTQPHEIDAQIFGFKRLSKLTRKPFDVVVRDWYTNNKDIHNLNDVEVEKIINMILRINNEKHTKRIFK